MFLETFHLVKYIVLQSFCYLQCKHTSKKDIQKYVNNDVKLSIQQRNR